MARSIHIVFDAEDSVTSGDIRDAVSELTEDDISVRSPISEGAPEIGTTTGDGWMGVVAGSGQDWTKTSQQAVIDAVQRVDGIGEVRDITGGYDS